MINAAQIWMMGQTAMEYDATCTITDKSCIYAGMLENCRLCEIYISILCDVTHQLHRKLMDLMEGIEK